MERYRIVFRKSVSKDLKGIPKKDVERILAAIQALAVEPRPVVCKKLSGQERYRIRRGNYRVLYEITDAELIVCVVKVGDQRDVYR